ncbi:hypothetical protein G8V07_12520 [Clostridium botulinum D/C]|uniref:hypothetical protein n=1 Tax=Clostridium botulinum TaxID=1491 RepID=UPI001E644EE1|nr:hypothetical protein [Clostridium botulinum]MCD3321133.1 hypothetical protein [Clostridium botulinum D/C]MCD3324573.1 hypothetical protein [Clostridium botulinum D/C]MCD3326861.1 hypothetical protein [Clostridium botulinum D/C]
MGDCSNHTNKDKKYTIKILLNKIEVDVPIFYNINMYKIFNKSFIEINDYKRCFQIAIYKLILKNNKNINIEMRDVEQIRIEELEKIAKHIIDSSKLLKELSKNKEFNDGDCFKKIYIMNKKIERDLKQTVLKTKNNIDLVNGCINNLSKVTNNSLQNTCFQNRGIINPSMTSIMRLSKTLSPSINMMNSITQFNGVNNSANGIIRHLNSYDNLNTRLVARSQRDFQPVKNRLIDIENDIQNIGLQMNTAFQSLHLQNFKYNNIMNNIITPQEAMIDSNIQGIKSSLMKSQVGNELLQFQLKGVKNFLNSVTKFNYGNKAISLDNLNKNILLRMRPFITEFNSIILSRYSITDNIISKAETMNSFGWWIISSLPLKITNEIDKNKDELNKDDVDDIICNYYSKDNFKKLNEITNKWNRLNYFNNKIDILEDSIDAHKTGKYSLSIPTLTPLIEGIIREFMQSRYGISRFKFPPVYNEFKNKITELNDFIATYVITCIDKLYCSFNPKNPNECSDFNRNKIFHGLANKYGSQANSLKVILFLDEIFEIILIIQGLELEEVI